MRAAPLRSGNHVAVAIHADGTVAACGRESRHQAGSAADIQPQLAVTRRLLLYRRAMCVLIKIRALQPVEQFSYRKAHVGVPVGCC